MAPLGSIFLFLYITLPRYLYLSHSLSLSLSLYAYSLSLSLAPKKRAPRCARGEGNFDARLADCIKIHYSR